MEENHLSAVWQKEKVRKKKRRRFRVELLFLVPSLFGVAVFYFIPFCDVVLRSFRTEFGGGFAGIGNYRAVIENKAFQIAVQNTIKFVLVYIPLLLAFSLFLAVMLDFLRGKQKFYKKVFLLPMAIPVASLVLIWKVFFDRYGLVNRILEIFGVAGWDYFHTGLAFLVLGITYLWRNFGYDMLLWKTGIDAIDGELYQAAALDGAGFSFGTSILSTTAINKNTTSASITAAAVNFPSSSLTNQLLNKCCNI